MKNLRWTSWHMSRWLLLAIAIAAEITGKPCNAKGDDGGVTPVREWTQTKDLFNDNNVVRTSVDIERGSLRVNLEWYCSFRDSSSVDLSVGVEGHTLDTIDGDYSLEYSDKYPKPGPNAISPQGHLIWVRTRIDSRPQWNTFMPTGGR
jgi:hypothetical protein